MSEKVYPDWVQKQKTTGTMVKNPVSVDTYIGKITPEGIEKSGSKKVVVNDAEVNNPSGK